MPKRPREHQLEDISVRFFERLLPPQWVCRRKQSDYGVDLEVEVFEDDGTSTSLTFIVQIKATDDAEKSQSVPISLDRVRYLAGHDAPSMIARYCDPTKTLHFKWVSNITAGLCGRKTESMTINFDASDAWKSNASQGIHRTLKVYRKLKHSPQNAPIAISLETDAVSVDDRFVLSSILSQVCEETNVVTLASDANSPIPVTIVREPNLLRIEIDVLTSVTEHLNEISAADLVPRILYALAFLMGQFGFQSQYWDLAHAICKRGDTTSSRLVAGTVAAFAVEQPALSAELACRNQLHVRMDEYYWIYWNALIQSRLPKQQRMPAIEKLIRDTIIANRELPDIEQATFHYNLANSYMDAGEYFLAVCQFNTCRRKSSVYLGRSYFLREFASCLFFSRRYNKAAELYLVSFRMDNRSKTGICAGDALMYSGNFSVSTDCYQRTVALAAAEDKLFEQSEAALKVWLSEWVAELYVLNDWTGTARLSDRTTWMSVIDHSLSEGQYTDALAAALMEGFVEDNDEGLWADALAFAFNTQDEFLIGATLSCAVWRSGYRAYEKFREQLNENGLEPGIIEIVDEQVERLVGLREDEKPYGYMLRFVNPEERETAHELFVPNN